jgi:hypothetical protein
MRALTSSETIRKIQESIYGQNENLDTKDRLKLCLQIGLYTPIDPKEYTRARVAAMLKIANIPRFLSCINTSIGRRR